MRPSKKILFAVIAILVIIQFFRPARNTSATALPTDISRFTRVPADVQQILKRSCYDCHSNNTAYPWYMNIQPVAWYLAHHVDEGKHELNFSEFGSYTPKKQLHKLQEVVKEVKEGEMPLSSYTLLHPQAKLSAAEKALVTNWADSLAAGY
jgi:hypothetical protein